MDFSGEQLDAIKASGDNFLVSAAAGSGKTRVLVERIMKRITDDGWNIDSLLVVTFTRAAAAEMKERIGKRIREELRLPSLSPSARERLSEQLLRLPNAMITTFDSFCLQLIRRNFSSIDLAPDFRQATEQETSLLRIEAMRTTLDEFFNSGDETFLNLAQGYTNFRGNDGLIAIIEKLHKFSESKPFPEAWINSLVSPYELPADARLTKTEWWDVLRDDLQYKLRHIKALVKSYASYAEENASYLSSYITEAGDFLEYVNKMSREIAKDDAEWDTIKNIRLVKTKSRYVVKKGTPDEIKEKASSLRDQIKKAIDDFPDYIFALSESEAVSDIRALAPDIDALRRVTLKFRENLRTLKRQENVVDFSDLEHLALSFLADEATHGKSIGELLPTVEALELQNKYNEVMVDEYQDTNGVQEAILSLVSRGNNIFTVGDSKQSIYRFRLAEPELFISKEENYNGKDNLKRLTNNYRSRREVLAAVNFIFAQILAPQGKGQKPLEIEYDKPAMLNAGMKYSDGGDTFAGSPVDLIIISKKNTSGNSTESSDDDDDKKAAHDTDESLSELIGFEPQARTIARKIDELLKSGVKINGEPIKRRDIAVLYRSGRDKIAMTKKALDELGIDSYAEQDSGYWQSPEICLMMALLRIIDNADQDIPLAAVITSRMGTLSYEELARIRAKDRNAKLITALKNAASSSEKVASFLDRLEKWRERAPRSRLDDFIWMLLGETGFYNYYANKKNGTQQAENLRLLADRAAAFEESGSHGLYRFIRRVDGLIDAGEDMGAASITSETDDVVRLMTIHKSKGLEFPVVILADCGKNINFEDDRATLLAHPRHGLGAKSVKEHLDNVGEYKTRFYYSYPTLPYFAVSAAIHREILAEEMRVLYVALTRAREKLILIGGVSDIDRTARKWADIMSGDNAGLPVAKILDAKSYLDLIIPAAMRHPRGDAGGGSNLLRDKSGGDSYTPPNFVKMYGEDFSSEFNFDIKILKTDDLAANLSKAADKKKIDEKDEKKSIFAAPHFSAEEFGYDDHGLASVPAKLSVTEIKRKFEETLGDEERDASIDSMTIESLAGASGQCEDLADDSHLLSLFDEQEDSQLDAILPPPAFMAESSEETPKGSAAYYAKYGTMIHAIMQHLDWTNEIDETALKKEAATLSKRGIIDDDAATSIEPRSIKAIMKFLGTPLADRIREAAAGGHLYLEQPFSRLLNARKYFPAADESERIFSQGIIDALFYDEKIDGYVLIDYKTDRDTNPKRARERHKIQIDLYRETIETLLKKKVAESYLVMLGDGSTVRM